MNFLEICGILFLFSIVITIIFFSRSRALKDENDGIYTEAENDRQEALKAPPLEDLTLSRLLKAQAKAASMELIDPNDFKTEL